MQANSDDHVSRMISNQEDLQLAVEGLRKRLQLVDQEQNNRVMSKMAACTQEMERAKRRMQKIHQTVKELRNELEDFQ